MTLLLTLLFGSTIRDLSSPHWPTREDASATVRTYPLLAYLVDGNTPEAERRLADVRERLDGWRVLVWAAAERHLTDEFVMANRATITEYAARFGPDPIPFPGGHSLMRTSLRDTMLKAPWYADGTEAGDNRHLLREILRWHTR